MEFCTCCGVFTIYFLDGPHILGVSDPMWVGGVPERFSIPPNLNSIVFTPFAGCMTDLQFSDNAGGPVRLRFIDAVENR